MSWSAAAAEKQFLSLRFVNSELQQALQIVFELVRPFSFVSLASTLVGQASEGPGLELIEH